MDANSNNAKRKYESAMPLIDEGWWESVLAEERQHTQPRPPQGTMKPKPVPVANSEPSPAVEAVETNWDMIQEIYSKDRIIGMKVVGHNRGGLLVESDDLAGFIPFSHLIDLAGKEHEADRDECLEAYVGRKLECKGDRMRAGRWTGCFL